MIDFKLKTAQAVAAVLPELSAEEVLGMLETPPEQSMGDYAFPCFRLAKVLRKAPNLIAADLAEKLKGAELFSEVRPVNAYVNMFLSREGFLGQVLKEIAVSGADYGRSSKGEGRKVIVEYSSPNIAKPFHIGHIRTTLIGNALYKIYDALGYDTVRINHLGDYGTQFGKMIVAYRLWGCKEDVEKEPIKTLLSYYTRFHEEAEKDPSLDDKARAAFTALENGAEEETALWQWFRTESLKEFKRVYDILGIEFDSYAGESFYSDKMDAVVDEMQQKGLLKLSEGAQIVDLEEYGMSPALIRKSDGSTLYITRDIAAAIYRKQHYDFYKNIYVVGTQQNLHFQQWKKVLELMGCDWAKDCIHVGFGMVSLEDGTLSTRKGRVVFLEDVLNRAVEKTREIILEKNVNTDNVDVTCRQVGIGAVVFNELSNSRIKDYTFSWDKVLNFDGETGPYVQYTHARAASVLRNAGVTEEAMASMEPDCSYLNSEEAWELGRLLYNYPKAIEDAAEKFEPCAVARHVVDIAQSFNRFYHNEHILVEDQKEKEAKLLLTYAAKRCIKNGLELLGMEVPERM